MIDGIRNSAQRGANLTKQLLAFARAQPLELKQIELKEFFCRGDDPAPAFAAQQHRVDHRSFGPAVADRR